MAESFIMNLGQAALMTIFLIAAPILFTALAVGVSVSIFQAVTQIQDMTLTFVPKFIVTGVMILTTGGLILTRLERFTLYIFQNIAIFTQ